jgi:predicted PurR-regulated permease PerM
MHKSRFTILTFVALLLLSLILLVHLLFAYISPAVLALVVVSLTQPIHQKILFFCKGRDYLAASVSTLLVLLCILIPLVLFFISLIEQSLGLYYLTQRLNSSEHISRWLASLNSLLLSLNKILSSYGIAVAPDKIIDFATNLSQALGLHLYSTFAFIAANLLSLCLTFFLTVAFIFIFFVSGKALKSYIVDLIPLPNGEKERLVKRLQELSSAIFVGNGLISLLEGLIGGTLFLIFDISGALIWGAVMAAAAFLPLVGATIVVVPAAIYLFLVGKTWSAILFASLNLCQLIVLDTLIKPKVIGTKSQMHAVLVFLSIISGVQIYGALGLFYGPLVVTIFLTLAEIYKEQYRNLLLNKESKGSHASAQEPLD